MQQGTTASADRTLVRSLLRTKHRSPKTYRAAQELAWRWVRVRWPGLVPAIVMREDIEFRLELPGRAVSSSVTRDGACWILEVTHRDSAGNRVWKTQAVTARCKNSDVLAVQTSCSAIGDPPAVVAPPKLLVDWAQRFELEDGGVPISDVPMPVADSAQLDAFWAHVASPTRALPIVALTCKRNSRYYGLDPRNLAQALQGVAHVRCLTAESAAKMAARLGGLLAPVPGALRIYVPGADWASKDALIGIPGSSGNEPGEASFLRKRLCRDVCALGAANGPAFSPEC